MSFEISVEEIEELIETGNLNIDHALKELGATSQSSLNKPPSQSSRTEGNDGGTKISRNPAPVEAPAHTSTAQRSHNEENESGRQNLDSLSMISNKPQTGTLLMGSDTQLPSPSKTYQGLILDAKKRALNEPRRDQKITNEHGSMNDTRIFKRGEYRYQERGLGYTESEIKNTTPTPRHRREYSISWVNGRTTISEWCNPCCAPVKSTASVEKCTCGRCPKICELCIRDP
ncbi:non-structural protein V [Human parainfluenza virus 4a]|uniref:Non-structural protein V n=2 Tax=Human parainfluenza virus 4a TaxID=11224 RepID=V_PI4HA|nr:non-structural protein V [Human parainfluenza virus 4a]P21739.1 RecName: Full=Non-structural protein V [Human parainfluenza virus 4a (strain Toshiba)]AAA46805.1 V [Human parainfluenza virus 4a] [Human parainfluenza virus 4a]BAJ11743.1 non-structural protein V [Human parainfluenza virus 4a]